ncbi:MAG: hypothetical protein WCK42_00775 [Myxococcaceae bacterium]
MIKLFVRQPFTQSGHAQKHVVQGVLDVLGTFPVEILTGTRAEEASTFKQAFERRSGLPFSPRNFREERLALLKQADAMVVIRAEMSESSAFEVAYSIASGLNIPIFFAVWKLYPIKTTLLQDLGDLCPATYVQFEQPEELKEPLELFLRSI